MKYLILLLFFVSFKLAVIAQINCPNTFKCGNNFVDTRDGNIYKTVRIGTQCWMVENLKATKYLNGDTIANVKDTTAWEKQTTGARCDYDNSFANGTIYGHIYNWYTVNDNRSLCPMGWYVPTVDEWIILVNYIGGQYIGGGALKSTSALWTSPNTGATNSSGFSALPGGYRDYFNGQYLSLNELASFWSSSEIGTVYGWFFPLFYNDATANPLYFSSLTNGFSVRCMKYY